MSDQVCAVDMGTTAVKAALLDAAGRVQSEARSPAPPLAPWQGFLAFDAETYLRTVFDVVRRVLSPATVPPARVAALAISSQRATLVPVGRNGRAAGPALSWQDASGDQAMRAFAAGVGNDAFQTITGLPPSYLWSLAKVLRLRRACPALAAPHVRYALLHDYTLLRFGSEGLLTDPSNASVTGLMDCRARAWSGALLAAAGLTSAQWPEIRPAATLAGVCSAEAAAACGLPSGTPLVVGGGDQQCATLGAGVLDAGEAALCLGTAAVISCPLREPVVRHGGGFFCTAHVVPDRWVLEGLHASFGGAIQWAMRALGCATAAEFDALVAASPAGAGGVAFLPFLAGAASPEFDAARRACFANLSLTHTRADLARAVVEGIACDLRRILDAAARWVPLRRLLVSGGGLPGPAAHAVFAALAGHPLHLAEVPQTTQLGTAMLAWTGVGRYPSLAAAAARMAAAFAPPAPPPPGDHAHVLRAYSRWLAACLTPADSDGPDGAPP